MQVDSVNQSQSQSHYEDLVQRWRERWTHHTRTLSACHLKHVTDWAGRKRKEGDFTSIQEAKRKAELKLLRKIGFVITVFSFSRYHKHYQTPSSRLNDASPVLSVVATVSVRNDSLMHAPLASSFLHMIKPSFMYGVLEMKNCSIDQLASYPRPNAPLKCEHGIQWEIDLSLCGWFFRLYSRLDQCIRVCTSVHNVEGFFFASSRHSEPYKDCDVWSYCKHSWRHQSHESTSCDL